MTLSQEVGLWLLQKTLSFWNAKKTNLDLANFLLVACCYQELSHADSVTTGHRAASWDNWTAPPKPDREARPLWNHCRIQRWYSTG